MKIINALIVILLLLSPVAASATGWNDYELDLGDGYSIMKASSFNISLLRDHQFLVSSEQYKNIGPIIHYSKTPTHIFIKTAGWKTRNLFPRDSLQETDLSRFFCFVVRIQDGFVEGPLSEEAFAKHPSVLAAGEFKWTQPKNPNFWRPILGSLFFLSLAIPILYVKYWYVSVPVTVAAIWLIRKRKARHNIQRQTDKPLR